MKTTAYLRRERFFVDGEDGYHCRIRGAEARDDGLRIEMGEVETAWYDLPLPPCPDCGGELVWAEAGYVPGTRQCTQCESLFSVQTEEAEQVDKGPEKFSYACDNGHRWEATEEEDEAADHKCPTCGEYWQ